MSFESFKKKLKARSFEDFKRRLAEREAAMGMPSGETQENQQASGQPPSGQQDIQPLGQGSSWTQNLKTLAQNQAALENPLVPQAAQGAAIGAKTMTAHALGAIPDTAALAYNLPAAASNAAFDTELPLIPSATEAIDRGIDRLTGGYTQTPEHLKPLTQSLGATTGVATGGVLGKTLGMLGKAPRTAKALNWVGSTDPAVLGGAAMGGYVGEKLHQSGSSAPVAVGGSLGASLAATAASRKLGHFGQSLAQSLRGLNKGQSPTLMERTGRHFLGTPDEATQRAYSYAKELNIPTPSNAVFAEPGSWAHTAEKIADRGQSRGKLAQRQVKTDEAFKDALADTRDQIGPFSSKQNLDNRWDAVRSIFHHNTDFKLSPQEAESLASDLEHILREKIGKGMGVESPSALRKAEDIVDQMVDILREKGLGEDSLSIGSLINEAMNNNFIMKDIQHTAIKPILTKVNDTLYSHIDRWAKNNNRRPEVQFYTKTRQDYATYKKYKAFDDLMERVVGDPTSINDAMDYRAFARKANDPKLQDQFLHILGKEGYENFTKLGHLAKAFVPQGERGVETSWKSVLKEYGPTGALLSVMMYPLKSAIGTTIGIAAYPLVKKAAFSIITNERLMKAAMSYAQKPQSAALERTFAELFKEQTGASIQNIVRQMQEDQPKKKPFMHSNLSGKFPPRTFLGEGL